MNVMFQRKFEKPISIVQIKVFCIVVFLCFFCAHYCSFALLAIIKTAKWQRTHINKASNINKMINYNYEIMAKKSRYNAILNFLKNYNFELSRSHSFQLYKITFASLKYLYPHKIQTFLWWSWLIWLSATFKCEKLTGLIYSFSQ